MEPQLTHRATIVIPAASQDAANAWMKANFDPVGGEHSFTVPLIDPATPDVVDSYWCSTACTEEQYTLLKNHFGADCYDGALKSPPAVLATEDLTVDSPGV